MVEINQADREAAASIAVLVEMRELIREGRADHHAEPFARHRIAAENAAQQEITALRARIAELEAFQQQAIKQVCELAREAGEAKGKLEASELPGIVDGWLDKCERLERHIAALEKDRAESRA